jgi:hypothetical protein
MSWLRRIMCMLTLHDHVIDRTDLDAAEWHCPHCGRRWKRVFEQRQEAE